MNSKLQSENFELRNRQFFHDVSYREPHILGHFSVDGDRSFINDTRNLKYLVGTSNHGDVHFDLNDGFDKTIFRDNFKNEKIDTLLKWITNNKSKIPRLYNQSEFSLNSDFLCFRGLMTRILLTPFEDKESWKLCATKFNGTIYMCEYDTVEKIRRAKEMTKNDIRMTSYGYKFEQFMTTDSPGGKADLDSCVNQNEEYCLIFRTRMNAHSIMSGAEVDCVDSNSDASVVNTSTNARNFIELKTSKIIQNSRHLYSHKRYKLKKWWAQSYLIGIPRIICGLRDNYGMVHELETYDTASIPDMAVEWDPRVCKSCFDHILTFIKHHVCEDDHREVFMFEYFPKERVKVRKLYGDALEEFKFLPDWYIDWMNEQRKID